MIPQLNNFPTAHPRMRTTFSICLRIIVFFPWLVLKRIYPHRTYSSIFFPGGSKPKWKGGPSQKADVHRVPGMSSVRRIQGAQRPPIFWCKEGSGRLPALRNSRRLRRKRRLGSWCDGRAQTPRGLEVFLLPRVDRIFCVSSSIHPTRGPVSSICLRMVCISPLLVLKGT